MVTRQRSTSQAVFHALADPTRRRLLDELSRGPRPAGALARRFTSSRPAVARHLRVLRQAGLVRVRPAGRERVYALEAVPLKTVALWIGRYEAFWRKRLDELADYLAKNPETYGARDSGPGHRARRRGLPVEIRNRERSWR